MRTAAPLHRRAFTLIEMLTVMAVIAILAGLTVAVLGFVNRKAGVGRAQGEIATMSAGITNYKADNGNVPRHTEDSADFDGEKEVTDGLDPRKDGDPTKGKYKRSSLFLYSELTGDKLPAPDKPDGIPDGKKSWMPDGFPKGMLDQNKERTEVKFLKDPFGNSYGYSTAALKQEIKFYKEVRKDPTAKRSDSPNGFNGAGFDLWSTGGSIQNEGGVNGISHEKWIKNW